MRPRGVCTRSACCVCEQADECNVCVRACVVLLLPFSLPGDVTVDAIMPTHIKRGRARVPGK